MPDKASKLLESMRGSKANRKREDLIALYKGFGFEVESRTKHDRVWHPDHPELYDHIPRHRRLAVAYVAKAVKLIDRLHRLQEIESSEENDG